LHVLLPTWCCLVLTNNFKCFCLLLTNDKVTCQAEQHAVLESCNTDISDISYWFFPSLRSWNDT
jgi:hypothetical protein